MHAVLATERTKLEEVRFVASACNILPAHGRGLDMYIEKKCACCLRRLGLACPKCKGKGSYGKLLDNSWSVCGACLST